MTRSLESVKLCSIQDHQLRNVPLALPDPPTHVDTLYCVFDGGAVVDFPQDSLVVPESIIRDTPSDGHGIWKWRAQEKVKEEQQPGMRGVGLSSPGQMQPRKNWKQVSVKQRAGWGWLGLGLGLGLGLHR